MKSKKFVSITATVTAATVVGGMLLVNFVGPLFTNYARPEANQETTTTFNVNSLEDITDMISNYSNLLGEDAVLTTDGSDEVDETSLSADDLVWTIVKMKKAAAIDRYLDYAPASVSLNSYVTSQSMQTYQEALIAEQDALAEKISSKVDVYTKYNYTVLLNGMACLVRYGDIKAIENVEGVDKVIISEVYKEQQVTENKVEVYSTGIYDSSNVSYKGDGTIVAILDTGLDYTHSAFQHMPQGEVALTKDDVNAVLANTQANVFQGGELTVDNVYVNSKVPFAYDYADKDYDVYPTGDHGTHVAGIIAGKDDQITGVATEAQLAIMKVFANEESGAQTTDILAALQDCVLLNVDVINMSLGSSCGFSREEDDSEINAVYDKVKEAGISLIVAASNDYSSAMGSAKGDTNLTSNPDSGTIGSPSSYPAALSVASISGVKTKYFIANGSTPVYFQESSKASGKNNDFLKGIMGDKTTFEAEYVTVPGTGASSDYIGLDVKGKIALVKRGVTTFKEKILTAEAKGAIGIIIYNNQSGSISMSVGYDATLPSCSIKMDVGNELAKYESGVLQFSSSYEAGPFMSGFSSWGVLPDLELKPDITAHGGDIYSSVRGGYDTYSGTSMACPNFAGVMLLVHQYLKEKYPNKNDVEITNLAYQICMSTATIANNEEGNPYSPRKQGAGLAALANVVTTKAYLWVDGSNKTKVSLGDDPNKAGKYEITFNLTNISANALSYNVSFDAFTESVSSDGKTVAEKAYMFNDAIASIKVNGVAQDSTHVTVAGYDTVQITLNLSLTDADMKYLDANFANGMFVEGYVKLANDDGVSNQLNIPYCGFYGDWTQAPILDVTAYEVADSAADSSILDKDKLVADVFATIPCGGFRYQVSGDTYEEGSWGLGVYGYKLAEGYTEALTKEDKAAITKNLEGLYEISYIQAGLLRGVKKVDMIIIDSATGEVVYKDTYSNARKSHYSGGQTGGAVTVNLSASEYNLNENSRYTFTMVTYLDWAGEQKNLNNTFSFSFYVDSEAPTLERSEVRVVKDSNDNKKYYLDMYVYDNHYIQCYSIATYSDIVDGELQDYDQIIKNTIPVESGRGVTNKITLDITNYWDDLLERGEKISLTFLDYARNESVFNISLPRVTATDATFDSTEMLNNLPSYTVRQGRTVKLLDHVVFNPVNSWEDTLVWTSSDESVARVFEGEVYAIGTGDCTVTVTTADGCNVSCNIHVTEGKVTEPTLEGIKLNKTSARVDQGSVTVLKATLTPWYYDSSNVEITWRSSNNKIATVEVNPENPLEVFVTAKSNGTVSIVASSGRYITSKCQFVVRDMYEVEGVTLKKYNGVGDENGVVEIPDDLGIVYIYQYAFFNNDTIKKVIIPEGVTEIQTAAIYGCENLEEVVFPSTMQTIDQFAVAWNPNLKKVDVGGTITIHDLAFVYDEALTDINLENVSSIGARTFAYCSSLETIDISNCGGVGNMAFMYCTALRNVTTTKRTNIAPYMFYNCTALEHIELYATKINQSAFANCTGLKEVYFMTDVDIIDQAAFYNCSSLAEVDYLGTVREIADYAFANCSSYKNVYIPAGVEVLGSIAYGFDTAQAARFGGADSVIISKDALIKTIDKNTFYYCTNIQSFVVEAGNPYLSTLDGVLFDKAQKELILYPYAKAETTYTVPASVDVIGEYAFSLNINLNSVDASNVKKVYEGAFMLSNVKTVNFSNKLTYVGAYAFQNAQISSFDLPDTVKYLGDYAYDGASQISGDIVLPANLEYVGAYAFNEVTGITSVTFGNMVKELGEGAFTSCSGVIAYDFGDSITKIGSSCFSANTSLSAVKLPDSALDLGASLFYGCTALKSVTLPNSLTAIPDGMFGGCTKLTTLTLPAGVKTIGQLAFYQSAITNINLDNVEFFERGAFASNTTMTTLNLPSAKNVGELAFAYCSFTSVTAPVLETVGANAFAYSQSMKTFTAKNLKEIGTSAFANCKVLSSITTLSVETISDGAFAYCSQLKSLILTNLKYLGTEVFNVCAIESLDLPNIEFVTPGALINTPKLTDITVDNEYYVSVDNVLYQKNEDGNFTLVSYPLTLKAESYSVKDRTVRIESFAFYGNKSIKTVVLPETVKQIGDAAFYTCKNLTSLTINTLVAPSLDSHYDDSTKTVVYRNFVAEKGAEANNSLVVTVPANGSGYTSYIYKTYFTNDNLVTGTYVARTETTLMLIDMIASISKNPSEKDKDLVSECVRLYNTLTKEQKALVSNYSKLESAKNKLGL